jgi:hypothetical protein
MDTPFASAYENLLVKYGTDYQSVRESYPEQDAMQRFFGSSKFLQHSLPNAQVLDLEALAGRLRSSSYAPQQGHPNFEPMLASLEQLFRENQQDGRVHMEYSCHMYFGQLVPQS